MRTSIISVIIPTYNNEHFIRFALESLFQQTYPEECMEIIVVNDGSTDNTHEILEEFKEKIIYVHQENKGIAGARNKGMSMAKGEIITFLDADDIWYEDRLKKVVEKFNEKEDAGMVYHPVELIDSEGNTIYKDFYKAFGYRECLSGWVAKEIFSGQIFCGGSSFAFKKEIIDKVYPVPKDIRRGIDYYMTAVSSCYATVEYIPAILGKYRMHGSNTTMLAGQENYKGLSLINKDFACMRQKTIEKIQSMNLNTIMKHPCRAIGENLIPPKSPQPPFVKGGNKGGLVKGGRGDSQRNKTIDVNIIKRIQAKEIIFHNILNGKRWDGIKRIPLLFKGSLSVKDLFNGIAVSFMALFIPSFLYPELVKMYGLLKRLKIIKF